MYYMKPQKAVFAQKEWQNNSKTLHGGTTLNTQHDACDFHDIYEISLNHDTDLSVNENIRLVLE